MKNITGHFYKTSIIQAFLSNRLTVRKYGEVEA